MKRQLSLALCALTLLCASCAMALDFIHIARGIFDALDVALNSVQVYEDQYLSRHPEKSASKPTIDAAIANCRAELEADKIEINALQHPTRASVTAIVDRVYPTYEAVLTIARDIGVVGVPLGHMMAAQHEPDALTVPNVSALRAQMADQS